MEKGAEGRASSDDDGVVSTSLPISTNDHDAESYPPTKEVIPIMFATSIIFFLVTLVSSSVLLPHISVRFLIFEI